MSHDDSMYPQVEPIRAGLAGRCPRCGRGPLFKGLLSLAPECSACGLDYSFIDAGDGPAVFVILFAGIIVTGMALWVEVTWSPPVWVHAMLWLPVTLLLCLPMLRMLKGVLITLQYSNRAGQGRLDHDRKD
ncbi:DUF983 domain-containing protein [Mangrovibrevibacter kandeliae]|uniref:DUF983 domain-containing protein n=1 Tax=Mangrovibrevibacter kandeliae TaxID=2968473 RepID=UPI00211782BB|nr:DUF983 domain-containing protein [Aurantimonas sp. CSK15Z-1]MCQ8780731.1 DUF983 domain-containing protein [Aurantimonas sp. CSK15Z-1]